MSLFELGFIQGSSGYVYLKKKSRLEWLPVFQHDNLLVHSF